jgi:hypothetical protein
MKKRFFGIVKVSEDFGTIRIRIHIKMSWIRNNENWLTKKKTKMPLFKS